MPGPSNTKKKRKSQGKPQKKRSATKPHPLLDAHDSRCSSSSSSRSPSQHLLTPPPIHVITSATKKATLLDHGRGYFPEELVPQTPFIYDPGTGPRVRDTRAFLTSRYFSQPPALDVGSRSSCCMSFYSYLNQIPLCAEFAQEEVLQMLCTVLPEETALVRDFHSRKDQVLMNLHW